MHDLIQHSLQVYQSAPAEVRVTPSIPILYFGDREAYQVSPLRIITVGLNPSLVEFPEENPFQRFPSARQIPITPAAIERALNAYFENSPYHRWFHSFEAILRGFRASFYRSRHLVHQPINRALHTDLLSPIATNPTWSNLSPMDKAILEEPGLDLWHSLIERLEPDLMLISVAEGHLTKICFERLSSWQIVHTVSRKVPYHFQYTRYRLRSGHVVNAIFGMAAQTPFGSVKSEVKARIGTIMADQMHYRDQRNIQL
ncbi:hypothetical protein RY831_14860 [Noviherbaspirillum sp. CPCC 100848]|uniref:Uncharacterized protein n=1 Tax=Noviherbaspirillum album TaxID=3080276 RepID=A0ABU6JAH4_9BURK|nr:hypothetical protein [Noviherbaspirillum sp. CPCC 100848]MEC4720441.1 hypothetical protein [Noviherbaspirillum sp. CPCC 100848]